MMKENIIRIMRLPVAAALVTVAVSCVGLFDEFNRNPNETTDMELQRDNYNVGGKLLQLQNCVIPTEEHLYQFTEILAGMSYGGYAEGTVPDWSTRFSTFNPSSDWLKAPFVDVMTDTYAPYRGIYAATEDPVPLALADILRVATMHRLTDQYGPIPYSKVMENKENSLTVAYDTQEEVYLKMFEELDDAIVVLKNNWDLPAEALMEYDKVYNGNIAQWVKYANSLKLRMAMRLSYVNPELSKQKASEAIAGGIMATNADNAAFKPDINRTAMIWNDWMDHIISADLVSYMGGYNDPRRYKMFIKKSAGILNYDTFQYDTKIDTLGAIRIGTRVLLKDDAIKYGSRPIIAETDPILWMNAAEVAFLQAEYHLRWGTMTDAGAWYRKGVELSFEERGAGDASVYLATETHPVDWIKNWDSDFELSTDEYYDAEFVAQSNISPVWNDEDEQETALERIIVQKWIAIFPLGNEAWAEHRRTGYPKLAPVLDKNNKSGGTVNSEMGARRLIYPVE